MNKVLYFLLYSYIFILALLPSKFKLGPIPFNGDTIIVLIIVAYIFCIIMVKDSREKFIFGVRNVKKNNTILLFTAYMCIMFLSILVASDVKLAIRETIRSATYLCLFFIIKNEISDRKIIKNLINCNIANIVILCIFGVVSYIFGFNVQVIYGINRIEATFENSNNFAMFLMLSVFPVIMLAISYKKHRWFYGILSLFMIVNIALAGSRNAYLGFGIGCVLLAVFYSWKFIAFIGGVGAMALIIPQVRGRILQIGNYAQDQSRIKLWRIAIDIIKDHPIRGIGNGNYPIYYKFYEYRYHYIDYYPESNVHPHNILLKVQSETGVFGLLIFIALIISAFLNISKFSKFVKDVYFKIYYRGFLVSFVVFILMNMIDNFFSAPKVIAYFWIFIAISQSIAFKQELDENHV